MDSKMTTTVATNDPNVRWGKKTISMTFMDWAYSATHQATVGGNCRALDNLGAALSQLYDELPVDEWGTAYIILTNEAGDTLQSSDEDDRQTDWLMGMLVSANLVSVEAEERD